MVKKLQKSDFLFLLALFGGLLIYLLSIYTPDHFADETFYPSIPLRLINGDSFVLDEWHLTQFSTIFLYFSVRIWLAFTGSTDGILLFLRFFYLTIHTCTAIGLYAFFRKHNIWAIAAALLFYTQVPLRFLTANYHSLLALFLLLFTITLVILCKKRNLFLYLLSGFFFGCCCICNPFDAILYAVYIIACLFQQKKKEGSYQYFFSPQAILKFSAGIAIAAILLIIVFFVTGGTLSGFIQNFPNLLTDTGHNIFVSPLEAFLEKIEITWWHFSQISFGLPFLLPLFYLVLWFDKKRKEPAHKLIYTIIAFLFAIFYTIGVIVGTLSNSRQLAVSLPIFIISTVCYILTQQKNKKLFYCMWLPTIFFAIAQYLASDLHLSMLWILIVCNIAGIFFIKDFLGELQSLTTHSHNLCKVILCLGICLQITFHCVVLSWDRMININQYTQMESGPYAGFYMKPETYDMNMQIMADLDIIKERSSSEDPVLIISEFSWMYLYTDRPFATYSAWQPWPEIKRLQIYYENNPEKKPKYIYVGWVYIDASVTTGHRVDPARGQYDADFFKTMFHCEQENLSYGILLTVQDQ